MGRLEKAKGVHDVIEAARELRGAELVIVGEGPYGGRLRAQAQGLSHVRFVGNQSPAAVAELYRGATALVAASLCYETFGLSVAEAMAHGKPAIVRRNGALAELVEETGAGLLFDDVAGCREAMARVAESPDLRRSLGDRGRRFAERSWSVDVHLRRYLDLIASLQAGGVPSPDDPADGPALRQTKVSGDVEAG